MNDKQYYDGMEFVREKIYNIADHLSKNHIVQAAWMLGQLSEMIRSNQQKLKNIIDTKDNKHE